MTTKDSTNIIKGTKDENGNTFTINKINLSSDLNTLIIYYTNKEGKKQIVKEDKDSIQMKDISFYKVDSTVIESYAMNEGKKTITARITFKNDINYVQSKNKVSVYYEDNKLVEAQCEQITNNGDIGTVLLCTFTIDDIYSLIQIKYFDNCEHDIIIIEHIEIKDHILVPVKEKYFKGYTVEIKCIENEIWS